MSNSLPTFDFLPIQCPSLSYFPSADGDRVIGICGAKHVYRVATGNEKECVTFLGTFTAAGDVVAPLVVLPYLRTPREIANDAGDFMLGNSPTGE